MGLRFSLSRARFEQILPAVQLQFTETGNRRLLYIPGNNHSLSAIAPSLAPKFSGEIAEEGERSDDGTLAVAVIFNRPYLILVFSSSAKELWVVTGKTARYWAIHRVNTITVRFRVSQTIILLPHSRSRSRNPILSLVSLNRLRRPEFLALTHITMDIWVTKPSRVNNSPMFMNLEDIFMVWILVD